MIVPFSTGSLYQVASLNTPPNYEIDISQLYNVASAITAAGATYGSLYVYLVGTDSHGSTWNLAAAKFVYNSSTGSFVFYLDFNGSANYPGYSFYYVNPGTGELALPVYYIPASSLTNTIVWAIGVNGNQLYLAVNGSQVFTTTFIQKPIALTAIYAYAAISTGSALQDLTAFAVDLKQSANIVGMLPDIIGVVSVMVVVTLLLRMFNVIKF